MLPKGECRILFVGNIQHRVLKSYCTVLEHGKRTYLVNVAPILRAILLPLLGTD